MVVKNVYSFCREPEFSAQHLHQVAHNHLKFLPQGHLMCLTSAGTTLIYTHIMKSKLN